MARTPRDPGSRTEQHTPFLTTPQLLTPCPSTPLPLARPSALDGPIRSGGFAVPGLGLVGPVAQWLFKPS